MGQAPDLGTWTEKRSATGHAAARAVLADQRFTNRPEHIHPPIAARTELMKKSGFRVPPGFLLRMDPPEHADKPCPASHIRHRA